MIDCSQVDSLVLKVFYYVDIFILIAKIAVPLLIIIVTMFDFAKSITSGGSENLISSIKRTLVRLICAILIFLMPSLIEGLCNIVTPNYKENSIVCVLNVSKQDIQNSLLREAIEYVDKLDDTFSQQVYNLAQNTLAEIEDSNQKEILLSKLNDYKVKYEQELKARQSSKQSKSTTGTDISVSDSVDNVENVKLKYYRQCGFRTSSYDTCQCGCGFTSLAMVVDGLNDWKLTPKGILEVLTPSKYSVNNCAIRDDSLYAPAINNWNINSKVLLTRNNNASNSEAIERKQLIVESLKKGHDIVLLIPGHYIALSGYNESTGQLAVYNSAPNKVANTTEKAAMTIDELYNLYYNYSNRCTTQGKCGFVYAVEYWK